MEYELPDCCVVMKPGETYTFFNDFRKEYEQRMEYYIDGLHKANKPVPPELKELALQMVEAKTKIYDILFNGTDSESYRKGKKEYFEKNKELCEYISLIQKEGDSFRIQVVLTIEYESEKIKID